jgi:glycerol-3-phosphate dehydrogenase (NAD(P)+)
MNKAQVITIVGDGAMATVLGMLLDGRGARVTLWGAFPDHVAETIQSRKSRHLQDCVIPASVRLTASDAEAFQGAELIVSAVPTQFMRSVWRRLAPHVPDTVPIVSVAKGIETDTLLRPTQIIGEVLGPGGDGHRGTRSLAALSGPSVAAELAECLPATVCVAADEPRLAQTVQRTFTTDWFRVYTNEDLLGVELAGATKNVIALAAGILDGLRAGINAKSALLARGLVESTRLGLAMGASRQTFYGLAGVGDLATTCFSPSGRNRTCGELLGRGTSLKDVLASVHGVVEGVPTTRAVMGLAEQHQVDMPIARAVHGVLFEGQDPVAQIGRLMTREPKAEGIG